MPSVWTGSAQNTVVWPEAGTTTFTSVLSAQIAQLVAIY